MIDGSTGIEWLAKQAHPEVVEIWTEAYNLRLERELWIEVMKAQKVAGLSIPSSAIERSIEAWEKIPYDVPARVRAREAVTRHDVKARLEIFCEDAGHEYHHLGMTSADIVDNCMLIKMKRSLERMAEVQGLIAWGTVPFRGVKGAVGTSQDQFDLLRREELVDDLERAVAAHFGMEDGLLISTGQVYPRSIDLQVLTDLLSAVTGRNIHGASGAFCRALQGYVTMASSYSGGQWNEGDVSTSVIRRVCIPGAFFAASAALLAL